MSSRDDILERVRRCRNADVPHPGEFAAGTQYDNPTDHFQSVLESVGGQCQLVTSTAAANAALESSTLFASAAKSYSGVEGVGRSTFDLQQVTDPHDLHDVDVAVLPGELAVAENAAIWVTTPDVRMRTLYFLVQHLALVLPRRRIVSNMHQAYETVTADRHPFGSWLAGPSKTADIEQSLVKGAHGARSLLVLILDD